jgi:hypothetical protein
MAEVRVKLRPDLQALVDAELERRRAEVEAERLRPPPIERIDWGRAMKPADPVEPYLVPAETPLYDAINVQLALEAMHGRRVDPVARGVPWPVHVPFPHEAVVPSEVVRQNAERYFADAAPGGHRQILTKYWAGVPWITAENYGGAIDWPSGGLVVKRGARGLAVYGFAELKGVRGAGARLGDPLPTGKVEVGIETFYVKQGAANVYFNYEGKVYDVPVLEIVGKVRKK